MKHPVSVQELTAEDLADEFANTTYGYQAEFYARMRENYRQCYQKDAKRGRIMLACRLYSATILLKRIGDVMNNIWAICEPRTNK